MLAKDGNTSVYVQYAHARTRSILRKAGETGVARATAATAIVLMAEPAERALALELLGFGAAVIEAAKDTLGVRTVSAGLYPSPRTAFTRFFESCPVLRAPGTTPREPRGSRRQG